MPSVLTQKIGPLPAWAWGGIAAVAAWYFLLRGKSSAAAPPSTATQGATTTGDYSLGFAQGLQSAAAAQPAGSTAGQAPGQPPAPLWQFGPPPSDGGQYVWKLTPVGLQANPGFQSGQVYPGTNAAKPAWPAYAWQWAPVPQGWTAENYAQSLLGSVGGAIGGAMRKHGIGSRSAHEWHDAHPMVGGPVRYPHYVKAVGGPGNHIGEVHRVARAAGVHPARVLMLNPAYTGRIRVA